MTIYTERISLSLKDSISRDRRKMQTKELVSYKSERVSYNDVL